MKKTIRILAVLMIVAMLSVSLVSCKVITGKYSATLDLALAKSTTTYEFGLFGKVTRTVTSGSIISDEESVVTNGKYEILENPEKPEELIIAFEFEGEERTTASFVEGVEGGVKYIKIGGVQYNEVK